jgi:hypothetical protein
MTDTNNADTSSTPVTYENVAQHFQFLPMVINSLQLVATSNDLPRLNNQVTRLHEAMKQSLMFLETMEGSDLTTKQQEELYEKYYKELQKKM